MSASINWLKQVQIAAHAVTGITRAQVDSDLFVVNGKVKNRTGEHLARRWQSSGETDFGIYDGEAYLRELLYCWSCYSGPSAARLVSQLTARSAGGVTSSHDHQGGIGMTTALLAKAFPSGLHTLTVGSAEHRQLAESLFLALKLPNTAVVSSGVAVDLLVAQETFEHFTDPIAQLRQVLRQCRPRRYFDASSFELTGAPGHFAHNKAIRPEFSRALADLGYAPEWRDKRFDERFDERKAPETLPTLWGRAS